MLMVPTSRLCLIWIKTDRCLVCMKYPLLIDVSFPSKYILRIKRRQNNDIDSTVLTAEYQSEKKKSLILWALQQTQHRALTLSSIDISI